MKCGNSSADNSCITGFPETNPFPLRLCFSKPTLYLYTSKTKGTLARALV